MAEAMTIFLGNVGSFFTQSVSWMGDVLTVVMENPVLLVMVAGMPIAGFAVGLLGRLFRL